MKVIKTLFILARIGGPGGLKRNFNGPGIGVTKFFSFLWNNGIMSYKQEFLNKDFYLFHFNTPLTIRQVYHSHSPYFPFPRGIIHILKPFEIYKYFSNIVYLGLKKFGNSIFPCLSTYNYEQINKCTF